MPGKSVHDTRPHAGFQPSFLDMEVWMTWRNSKLLFSMGVRTTRHWQTSGRLMQELNVCTITMSSEGHHVHSWQRLI